jgi:hypothetical protein
MERRNFIKAIGGTAAVTAIAGCTGDVGTESPPPRRSNVIESVTVGDDPSTLVVIPEETNDQWVQSRRDFDYVVDGEPSDNEETASDGDANQTSTSLSFLSGLSPIGVASAAKGRGATGRGAGGYRSAPKTSSGRAHFWGGAYVGSWYDDHDDEVEQYPVLIDQLGIAYLGTDEQFQEQDPGPGPVAWDETYTSADEEIETDVNNLQEGWYRVGANIVVDNRGAGDAEGADLGWECVDFRVEETDNGKEITEEWKVSPRI